MFTNFHTIKFLETSSTDRKRYFSFFDKEVVCGMYARRHREDLLETMKSNNMPTHDYSISKIES